MRLIFENVRYALRQFRKTPTFTATAILTLALGIGATTAIFDLIHAVLMKSLPVARPEELIRVGDNENCCVNGGMQENWSLFSFDQYKNFRDNNPEFVQLAAFQSGNDQISVRRQGSGHLAESFIGEFVSGNAFDTLGIQPYAGRLLHSPDDQKGAAPVAVMSFRTWQQKFGQDPTVVGASFMINGFSYTVVGVTPPGFYGERLTANPASFWLPLSSEPQIDRVFALLDRPDLDWLNVIGRTGPGINTTPVEARMQVQLRQWLLSPVSQVEQRDKALIPKQTLHLAPGGGGVQRMRNEYRDGLRLLMWISSFVLLTACANLANLMLVRAARRRHQTSVRSALGAHRNRLVRQALIESVVLSVLGGTAGLGIAYGGTRLILHLAFPTAYVPIQAAPSLPVLGFTFAASLLTGLLFGVAPAWVMARANPFDILRSSLTTAQGSGLAQKSLVVLEAAISLVLLCAAGLLAQSLSNMQNQRFGFETPNRYIAHIDPRMAGYKPEQMDAFYRQLHDLLAAIPGVRSVAYSLYSPMEGNNWSSTVYFDGQPPPPPGSNEQNASWVRASADYLSTIGTKMIAGRPITEQDTASTRPVAVVNKTFVNKFFKDGNALGKHFGALDQKYSTTYEIVGVTEDTQYWNPSSQIRPMFFLPAQQWIKYSDDPNGAMFENVSHSVLDAIELRTSGFVPGLEAQVRRVIAQVNPDLTVIDFRTFGDQVRDNFNQQSMIVQLTSLFGFVALALAAIGLYGVTAYSVAGRTREIGVRMALGADRMGVLKLVLSGAFLQVAIGLLIGIPASILGGRAAASQLFGVKPYDPKVLLIATFVLLAAALVAALAPARRAASIEPVQALRME